MARKVDRKAEAAGAVARASARPRPWAAGTVALVLAGLLAGCAGSVVLSDGYEGHCAQQNSECRTVRCDGVSERSDCEMLCDYEARQCQRLQGGDVAVARRSTGSKAMLIDLMDPRPVHSSTITLELSPEATSVPGAYELPPGAHLKATLSLPANLVSLEMHVAHAPGGDGTNCFVTATLGEKTLWGRYAPPRAGKNLLKREVFDLTRLLGDTKAAQNATLFLYNNATAGSTRPYRLASVEFFYRALEPRP